MSQTVLELVEQVRSQADEANTFNVSDQQIIDSLNRAQRKAANILARRYDELFWETTEVTTQAGQSQYNLPQKAFGRRVEKLEIKSSTTSDIAYEIRKISHRDRTRFTSSSATTRPQYYSQLKNKIELYPKPSAGLTLVVHYNATPERLVVPQGRITGVNISTNSVLLDAVGSQLTTSVTGFGAYVNIIDYVTGAVKGTLQLQSINTTAKQLVFKTGSLTRTTVLGRTISTALPSDIVVDDYVCLVTGSCVAEIPDAYQDYLIQYAVLELRRRHAEPTAEEYQALKELEDELLKAWAGRESSHRIRRASSHWGTGGIDRRRRRSLS